MKKQLHFVLKIAVVFCVFFCFIDTADAQSMKSILGGFRGNRKIHEAKGGLHIEVGGCFIKYSPFDSDLEMRGLHRVEYANYKAFPIRVELTQVSIGTSRSIGFGLGSAYFISDQLALNYGGGWQHNYYARDGEFVHDSKDFYVSLGVSYYPFEEVELWGNLRYTYNFTIGAKENPLSGHYVTYVFGKELNKYFFWVPLLYGYAMYSKYNK